MTVQLAALFNNLALVGLIADASKSTVIEDVAILTAWVAALACECDFCKRTYHVSHLVLWGTEQNACLGCAKEKSAGV